MDDTFLGSLHLEKFLVNIIYVECMSILYYKRLLFNEIQKQALTDFTFVIKKYCIYTRAMYIT